MCRLLATATRVPHTVAEVIGASATEDYLGLGRLHRDGWGSAWLPSIGTPLESLKGQHSGATDPNLRSALFETPAVARIVHERLAKNPPRAIRPGNLHPFTGNGMAFAHNGTLGNHNVLKWRMPLLQRRFLKGGTDSEIYFRMLWAEVDRGLPVPEATLQVTRTLRERLPRSSLNALVLTPTSLIVVHASEHTPIPRTVLNRRLFVGDQLPPEHGEHYYRMRVRIQADSIAVASTGFTQKGWDDLPHESVTTIDLANLTLQTAYLRN